MESPSTDSTGSTRRGDQEDALPSGRQTRSFSSDHAAPTAANHATPTPLQTSKSVHAGDGKDYTLPRRPWRRHITPWSVIVAQDYPGSGTENDPYVVDWVADYDHENPFTWENSYKWFVVLSVAIATMAVAMSSSTLSGATASIMTSFPNYATPAYVMGELCLSIMWMLL